VLLVHTPSYVDKLKTGTLTALEELQLEVPYSAELVRAFWLAAGGSMLAADYALSDGVAINIGGGFHHAFPDHGEGFCLINDVAVAIRCMQRDGKVRKAMTVDCDVHQGNGTAAIFSAQSGAGVFTISLHQLNNYPSFKPPSSLDLNLPDGLDDAGYLACLGDALSMGLEKFEPDLICYLAGADPYREDQLGGLSLTIDGLKRRDAVVFQIAKERSIPVMVTYAGGYASKLEDTVTIHCNTVVAAKEVFAGKDKDKGNR
jgi:acetoin utilization deacetylase AcuC-like enzyme